MKQLFMFIAVIMIPLFICVVGFNTNAETPKPAPKFKFGDIVKVTTPFYANCSSGVIMEIDPFTISRDADTTHTYRVDKIDCPYWDKDLHKTSFERFSLEVAEEDLILESRYHILTKDK